MVCEVRHVLLVLIVRVATLVRHWVLIAPMQTAVMHRAIIELLLLVIVRVMMTVHQMIVSHVMQSLSVMVL